VMTANATSQAMHVRRRSRRRAGVIPQGPSRIAAGPAMDHASNVETDFRIRHPEVFKPRGRVRADQLRLTDFLGAEALNAAPLLPLASEHTVTNVLITGANGFLGRFLVLSLLEQMPGDGRLYCIVRADTNEAAAQRLVDSLVHAPDLAQ